MEKKFEIAKNTFIDRKIVAFLVFIVIGVTLGKLNDTYGIFEGIDLGISILLSTIFISVPLLYIFVTGKNYRVIGVLTLNPHRIKIETKSETSTIEIAEIDYLILRYNGILGDSYSAFNGLWSAYSKDGSGNILEFKHNGTVYRINIVFESVPDFNAIKHLFRSIEKEYPIRPEILKDKILSPNTDF